VEGFELADPVKGWMFENRSTDVGADTFGGIPARRAAEELPAVGVDSLLVAGDEELVLFSTLPLPF
jgi:hypothetical protein